jgi:hypothetical protein
MASAAIGTAHAADRTLDTRAISTQVSDTARNIHAKLRYGSATTAACQSLSDTSSTVCLLLALNIIHMSQQPLPGGAM